MWHAKEEPKPNCLFNKIYIKAMSMLSAIEYEVRHYIRLQLKKYEVWFFNRYQNKGIGCSS